MSKIILFIISSYLLIKIIYCQHCEDSKGLFDKEEDYGIIDGFAHGYKRTVWHHADSCNSFLPENNDGLTSCCYIHIEYRSLIDGERYDQYGCIEVTNPWEDYDGSIGNVTSKVEEVETTLKEKVMDPDDEINAIDSNKNLHVKILCSANFLKLSLFSLLVLILF